MGYAVVVGLLQGHARSVLAYAAIALNGLWMALLGTALLYPQAWRGMADVVHAAVLQSGFALAALLLLERHMDGRVRAGWCRLIPGLMWIAALLLVTAPLGVAGFLASVDGAAARQVLWAAVAIAILAVRGLLPIEPAIHGPGDVSTSLPPQAPTATTLPAAGGLAAAALLAASYNLAWLSSAGLWHIAPVAAVAALAAWLGGKRLVPHLPVLPPGDLLVPIGNALAAALGRIRSWADTDLPLWRDTGRARLRRLCAGVDWRRIGGRFESALSRWPTALSAFLLLGLMAAWLGTHQ